MKILGISIIILIIGYTGISIATMWGGHVPIIYMKIMIPLVGIAFIATLIKAWRTGA